jgi:alpha-beta hydrolase superfamily lysophospholipase
MLGRARLLHNIGYSTLLVDLQAHGESPGDHITAGYRERHDVAAAVNFVRSRNPEHLIGIVARSLGGAATLLATPLEIDALALESVYPTITDAIHNRISMRLGPFHHILAPALLVQLKPRLGISPSQLRPIDHVAGTGCPVLVAGGDRDLHTTLAETERLYDAADAPKQLVIFAGAAHTDLLNHDPEQYRQDVIGFLDTHLRPGQENHDPEESRPQQTKQPEPE